MPCLPPHSPHHGDQQVEQEDDQQGDEQKPMDFAFGQVFGCHEEGLLTDCLVSSVGKFLPGAAECSKSHDEHLHRAVHECSHWIIPL